MKTHSTILAFLGSVKKRLDQAWLIQVLSRTLLAISSLLCLWCIVWIAQGHAVPKMGYLVAGISLPILALGVWLLGRVSTRAAARLADEHFKLKDAISSHLGFSQDGREGDFIGLQAEATAAHVATLSPASIPVPWPRRLLTAASVLLLACLVMGFRKATPEVMDRLALEEVTGQKTEEINKGLEEDIEKLIKTASEEEKELIKPDDWRRWVKELKEIKDPKDAMRQYAELERRLSETAQKLNQRETEQLLSKAAQEMQQAAELKPISKSLEEQSYRKAAEQMRQMKLKADVRKPDEAQKELAKLKSAAQRMASAARNFQQRSGSSGGENQDGQKGMDQQMLDLDQATQNLQKSLAQLTPNHSECQSCQNAANDALDKLCQSMCKSAAKNEMKKKLLSLCQCLSQCQNCCGTKECQSPYAKPGGKKAGSSSVASRRDETDPSVNNGNQQQLAGQKGAGPSDTTTESADSGTGHSTRMTQVQEKVWKRQMESFIQREDVPSEVKEGVKEYFKGVQQVSEPTK
ncbi:MAG: hypothetical protein NTV80_00115 [Verrucomicrobia bacterium]|nr:hypothetical protein [Verrucomicrobiota bacterium]